jgi:multisubunit Na+/H+ antiporter MnhF subunit
MKKIVALCLFLVMVSSFCLFIRLILGPSPLNRSMALELLMTNFISFSALLIIYIKMKLIADYIIVCSLLHYIETVAFTKYIAQRKI